MAVVDYSPLTGAVRQFGNNYVNMALKQVMMENEAKRQAALFERQAEQNRIANDMAQRRLDIEAENSRIANEYRRAQIKKILASIGGSGKTGTVSPNPNRLSIRDILAMNQGVMRDENGKVITDSYGNPRIGLSIEGLKSWHKNMNGNQDYMNSPEAAWVAAKIGEALVKPVPGQVLLPDNGVHPGMTPLPDNGVHPGTIPLPQTNNNETAVHQNPVQQALGYVQNFLDSMNGVSANPYLQKTTNLATTPSQAPIVAKNPEEIRQLYKAGKLSRDEAKKQLAQFGVK